MMFEFWSVRQFNGGGNTENKIFDFLCEFIEKPLSSDSLIHISQLSTALGGHSEGKYIAN